MADAYQLEDASGRYLLEDGTGVYLLEQNDTPLTPSVGSLSFVGISPVPVSNTFLQPVQAELKAVGGLPVLGPQTLILRGQSPSLILGTVCQPSEGSLVFADTDSTLDLAIAISAGIVVLASDAGTIQEGGGASSDTPITTTVGSLVLASDAGSLILEMFCTPTNGSLVFTDSTPLLDIAVMPTGGSLVLIGRRGSIPGVAGPLGRLLLMRVG